MKRTPPIVIAKVKRLVSAGISSARLSLSAGGEWLRLPGSLELKQTGYQIRFGLTKTGSGPLVGTFTAFDPEGNAIASTPSNLEGLKQFTELQARAREELDL